jgi:uncharacterized membrane protein
MKKWFPLLIVVVLISLPFYYLFRLYPTLPSSIPTHFGFDGKPNGYSQKQDIIGIFVGVSILSAGCYVLIKSLPKIDPKKTAGLASGNLQKIAIAVVGLLSAILLGILYAAVHDGFSFSRLFNPLMGIFFIIVGNLMYNIKPNYFVGIRIPWTLENENNWRATHHMAAKLWVIGGILITLLTILLSPQTGEYFFIATTLVLAIVPIIYSFIYFKTHQMPV